jgi:4-amino-4-deoxy-L-arabinose transferase-like glycosyltransferase
LSSLAVSPARPPAVEVHERIAPPTRTWREPESRLVLLVVLAISVAYVGRHLSRGWMPYDDGALAQSAERLLQGELPHRDFDEIYTGGLAYLNAGAFRLFGTNLWSMRLVLLAVFVAWVPTVYYLASRLVRPTVAGVVTLLAVVWSLPNYTAPMPSWYNLFLATFGAAALFRHLEDGRPRWLVAAGVAGGLSFLVKVVGLYYVAGVLLYLVFQAHALARDDAGPTAPRAGAYGAFVTAALIVFLAALAALVRHQLHAPEVAQFILPGAAIAMLLVRNEWSLPAGGNRARFAGLARLLGPFLIGVALPVALFLVPYLRSGSVDAFANGVFVLPMRRFGVAVARVLPFTVMLACLPLAFLAVFVRSPRGRASGRYVDVAVAAALAGALAVILVGTGRNAVVYRTVWYSVWMQLPGLVVAGVIVLWRPRAADAEDPLLRPRTMALLCVAALCNLTLFPYFVANYFCYIAPLVLLTAVALYRYLRPRATIIPAMVLAFYAAFAVVRTNESTLYTMGLRYAPYLRTAPLGLERGGIDVPVVHAEAYRQLVPFVRSRARGDYIWASPDCPEVYFLTGLKNPTRSLFDFFDDTTGHTTRVLEALDAHGVTVVVMNARSAFSPPLADDLVAALETRYPYATNIGVFHVRWRP